MLFHVYGEYLNVYLLLKSLYNCILREEGSPVEVELRWDLKFSNSPHFQILSHIRHHGIGGKHLTSVKLKVY